MDEWDTDPQYVQITKKFIAEKVTVDKIIGPGDNKYNLNLEPGLIICPVCGHDYTHTTEIKTVSSDRYTAWDGGRGSADYIYMEGECGHVWRICLGFHKGQTYLGVEVPKHQK